MTKYKINMVYKFISIILIFLFLMPVTIIYAETPDITENTDNTTEDTDTITASSVAASCWPVAYGADCACVTSRATPSS